jgi:hypothetical protein
MHFWSVIAAISPITPAIMRLYIFLPEREFRSPEGMQHFDASRKPGRVWKSIPQPLYRTSGIVRQQAI